MRRARTFFGAFILLGALLTADATSVPIGYCPGLKKLIDSADAVVILRIDRDLSGFGSPDLYSTHECFIYQTLKGEIRKNTRIKVRLVNTEGSFATPYAHGSTHLMFLMKKATEDEPTEYRMLTFKGAQILLPPLGHENAPEGDTIEEKIKNLIKDSIDYQAKEHEKRQEFLKSLLGQLDTAKPSPTAVTPTTDRKPKNHTLTLSRIADSGRTDVTEYVFLIGVVAYRTLDGLRDYVRNLPKGSTLTWAPGCLRMGDEPLLSAKDEMDKFRQFCESCGVTFVLVPSG